MTLAQQSGMQRWAWLLVLSGCVGDLVELTPGSKVDFATQPVNAVDLGGAGDDANPAGVDLMVAVPRFDPTIQADIDALGCSAASCHGGTQVPLLKRLPVVAADITANYDAFKAEAMNGEASNILVKNLAGSGVTHTGGSSFAAKSDPIYQRWLAWINGGNPQ